VSNSIAFDGKFLAPAKRQLGRLFNCKFMRTDKLEPEFLKILTDQNYGAKLSCFEDWAACRSHDKVKRTLKLFAKCKFTSSK
jgi:hypothetical protein